MTTTNDTIAFEELSHRHVHPIAMQCAQRYRAYGLQYADVAGITNEYLHGPGRRRIEKWLAEDPPQAGRVYRALDGVARTFCEREKARVVGYSPDDVTWYTPQTVESLLPIAFETNFDGTGSPDLEEQESARGRSKTPANEHGNLVAQVLDIRQALINSPQWVQDVLYAGRDSHARWAEAVQIIVESLGGDRPWGYGRLVLSNAASNARTGDNYGG